MTGPLLESATLGSNGEGLGGGRAGQRLRVEKAAVQGSFMACGSAWWLHGVHGAGQ
jgi:hypothetical protein